MAFTKRQLKPLKLVAISVLLLLAGLAFSFFAVSLNHVHASSAGGGDKFNKPGNLLISDQFNNRAFIIDKRGKDIEFQYGMLNVAGNGPDQVNGPYTAFVIGDYTGQTPPPEDF